MEPLKRHVGINMDVFSRCNLRCPSCVVGNKFGRAEDWPKGYMKPDLLRSVYNKAINDYTIEWVAFYNWTEPLLHPNLPELVRITKKEYGLRLFLSSNLNLDKDYDFHSLLEAGPAAFRVSLSGFTQPIYERGHREGDIELVKHNMRRLSEAKNAVGNSEMHMEVFYHIYRYNYREVSLMKEYAESLGFKFWAMYAQVSPVEKVLKINAGEISPEDEKLLADLALPLDKAIAITSAMPFKPCKLMSEQLDIDVEGNVMLCCTVSMNKENRIGNFLDLSSEEIHQRRIRHSLCGPCLKLGIPNYYTDYKSTAVAAEIGYAPDGDKGLSATFVDATADLVHGTVDVQLTD